MCKMSTYFLFCLDAAKVVGLFVDPLVKKQSLTTWKLSYLTKLVSKLLRCFVKNSANPQIKFILQA